MNRIFRIIWSKALCTWVVASEFATPQGKGKGRSVDKTGVTALLDRTGTGSWGLRLGILTALLALYAPVQAADRYWDVNTTGVGNGGTGAWDLTSSFWSPNADGVSGPYVTWNNAALDDVFFGGTAGTVTLGTPITAHNLTFNTTGYTLTGSTLTLAGTTPTIAINSGASTIASVIAGTAGLTKTGGGILSLTGANTFSGGIVVNAGNLSVSGDAALGNAANGITMASGTSLSSSAALSASRVVTLSAGNVNVGGGGVGSARFTGTGNLGASSGVTMSNATSDYTGRTSFGGGGSYGFTSIADLGVASALGAPTTAANGLITVSAGGGLGGSLIYTGDGDSSNRNFVFNNTSSGGNLLRNSGTGTLTLTGDISTAGGFTLGMTFSALTADLQLLGTISSTTNRSFGFSGGAGRTITLGGANTYAGASGINGLTVRASTLTNTGTASSFGTGTAGGIGITNGVLSYTGAATSTDRSLVIDGASTVANDGTGALSLTGATSFGAGGVDALTLGGSYAGTNTVSGVVSGTGSIAMNGAGTWVLGGANTYVGTTTVQSGTLRAGGAQAFGTSGAVVNGGTLDLAGNSLTFTSLAGSGGNVQTGGGQLIINGPAATNTSYAGNIAGSGGLTKLGGSTLTLTGTNTYTGATNVGGGTLGLSFAGAGGPTSNIISSTSTLNMAGGNLVVTGATGEANTQTFNGLNVTAGSNNVTTAPAAGGTVTINLGSIVRGGGLVDFDTSASGIITTTNADGTLGGWATVNGSDYAKVQGGSIVAFTDTDYTDKDDAATWLDNEFISDSDGDALSFSGTVTGSKQLGGLQYTTAANSTVNVGAGQTLGIDGTIIVASTVGNTAKIIQGGNLTGLAGGGTLGVLQNGGTSSNFTIASTIIDNGGAIGFSKGGTGRVTLSGANTYTGATTLNSGTLSVNTIGNGGAASAIGASAADASNLVLENGTLSYTGGSTTTDRGFTLVNGGLSRTIEVVNGATNLTFNGQVTSPDNAGLTKTGDGTLTLGNGGNDYVGVTTVGDGTLSVGTLADGGVASGIGASSNASDNLILQGGGELEYTGATVGTDRGFTLGGGGGAVDVAQGGTTLTVGGTVVGAGTLSKNGPGTLVLSGTNTFTGGGFINGGVLQAGSTQAFGTGGWTIASGSTLDLNDLNNTVRALAGAGSVDLGSATLTLSGGAGSNFTGGITGTGGVTNVGGSQIFSGCGNTYTGATTINNSVIRTDCLANGGLASGIGASSAASANLTLTNNGILQYTGASVTIDRGINLGGGWGYVYVANGTTLGFTGAVVGPGGLAKRDQGTLVLSGTNTYTGSTSLEAGILRAGSTSAFGTGGVSFVDVAGAALDLAGFDNSILFLQAGGPVGGNVTLGSGTLTITNGSNAIYSGAISGTGGLVKSGGADQALAGCASSYTGSTTINAGGLTVSCLTNGGSNSSIGASSAAASNLVINGGYLQYNGAGNSTDRQFTLGGSGSLYSSGTGAIAFTSTAAVTHGGTANTARTLTLRGTNTGNNILAAQLTNNGTGATSLTKTDAGTWILTNPNSTYTGVTTISGGVLGVDKLSNGNVASSIGASSAAAANLVIGNGSTLRYTGSGDTTNRLFTLSAGTTFIESSGTGAVVFTDTGPVTLQTNNAARTIALGGTNTGNNTLAGSIGNAGTGVTTLAKNDSGTWVLTGNNTFTGNTTINDGNLVIGNGGTTGNAGAGNVIVNAPTSTLSINRSDAFNFTGTLSGPGTLAQIGTGTTILTSAGNTIGATTIGAGTLQVNGSLSTSTIGMSGTSALTVNGTVQAAGGTAATFTGDAGASTININGILLANGNLGGGSDVVNVAGTLNTGVAALNLGDGNDTLSLVDGGVISGAGVDGGLGAGDILQVNNAAPRTLSGALFAGFERLIKQGLGILTATGNHTFSAGTDLAGGTLDVDGSVTTPTVTMADGTTLNVDGTLQAAGGTAATLTGSAGVNTVLVNTGATLRANGDLGGGNDVVTLAGTLDTGAAALNLGSGDDTVTLNDGAALTGVGINAGAQTASDALILNNALGLAFDGSRTVGFESLIKQNTGTATMTGAQTFTAGTTINGGVLDVDGNLTTPTVALADGTTLNVDGALQGAGGTAATITGSAGINTVTITGTAIANGDLGGGNDVLDVSGTLDIGGGVFALGDGDDSFVVHDGTNVIGAIDGGAGLDSRVYNINGVADLGALVNFEGITKTGTGTLNLNGPGTTELQEVEVLDGTLNVGAGANVAATAGSTLNTVVGSGATLNVDGSFGCGAGDDTITVGGAVTGSGTIDLCGGDDTLTLNDGADLGGFGGTLDGGLHSTADRIVLNNAGAMNFSVGTLANFEILQKDNIGEATLNGSMAFSGGTLLNDGTLTVAGNLTTPTLAMAGGTTLNVGGTLQGAGGTAAQITGGAGVETTNITGTATATGDLGGGNDVLDVTGTLDTDGGVFALGDGNDSFVVHDGSNVIGTIDGGAGLDSRVYNINGSANLGALVNFEGVTKTGTGTLNIDGPVPTDLQDVQVLGGTLDIGPAGSVVASAGSALNTVVGSGATLNVDGSYGCGAQADTMTVSGTVSGTGDINLCGGDDTLTLNDGAVLANLIDGDAGAADTVVLNNAGAMTFAGANTLNFEILHKDNTGEATLTGASTYIGGTALNGGMLTVAGSLATPTLTMADNTSLNVTGTLHGGGLAAAITGSAGVNTVTVAAGATLTATGDLGDGSDVLDAAGTIDTDGGVLSLGAGDDTFNVYDTTDTALATIDGGAGNDLLDVTVGSGNTVPLGGLLGFESLGKSGLGTLEIHGVSDFIDVDLNAGTLRVTDTGSVSATNTTILAGATLELADGGSYSGTAADDTFTVAGTVVSTGSNVGTIDLGGGNDTFTLQDGADLSGLAQPVNGGAGTDNFVADLASTATLGGAIDFETLTKTNSGTLIVAGPAASTFATVNVDGGTLDIGAAGSLTGVQNATVASGATLNVDGVFGFTAGADSFTVAGTVTGASTINMLDGDDTFTIQDDADLSGLNGPVDGGAGTDTFVTDLAGTATLGGAVNFEALNKTNTGTLIVAGPASSSFNTVNVQGGTLDIGVNGSLNGVVAGTVASGATLNVDGSYTGSTGGDTLTVAGTVTGNGDIALGNGDDTLTLNDGADLSGFGGTLDGGAHSGGDRVVLNNAGAMNFNAANIVNFEFLQKDGVGEATLTGNMSFSGGTQINGGTLIVGGALTTPALGMADGTALNVDGMLQGGLGGAATITGSAGVNTVTVTGVAIAQGDLGAGNDVLDITGTLATNGGTFALGDGDDDFVVHDGTIVNGTIDGGAGLDSRVYDINANAEFGALLNFEGVTKRGTGTLNISGPGATDLQSVEVEGGTLNVGPAGSIIATAGSTLNTVVASGATLNVDGSFGCGAGADTMTVAGTVSGSGTVDLCSGTDTLTLQDGAVLANIVSGGADIDTVVLDNAAAMTFDGGNTINFEVLQKDNVGVATLTGNATYTGGTLLNGGTLTVAGSLTTPTLAMADDTTLNVGGALQNAGGTAAAITGSAGTNTVNVAGTALANGDLGGGNDVLDVTGTLNTGSGVFELGDGDDTLTIHDGTNIVGTVVAGAGNDTFNTDIATNADLGAVQGFETLSKTGIGTLDINGPMSSDFTTVNVLAGTVNVAAGGSVAAQNTTVAAGATLQIAGSYGGTASDDSFTSMGTVRGALAFGVGADTARFVGGDISGLTSLDGGAGNSDLLSFSGLQLQGASAPTLAGWERVELLNDSSLTLGGAFDLSGGVLAIDATSTLFANAGASLNGSVENAGLVDVGLNRLAISGGYTSNAGALQLTVSPGTSSSGGLNISGDVVGTTRVVFDSDGSSPAADAPASILVISSPNDNTATAGSFVPSDSPDGFVRLEGSVNPWTFGQQADNNWYLNAETASLLPEISGYGVLPSLGTLLSRQSGDLVHQRLAGVRSTERPQCGGQGVGQSGRAGATTDVMDDCHGLWVAATASELELGADPGFEVSGDDVGLYVGIDGDLERDNRTIRAGGYVGFTHGVYWTTGVSSTELAGTGPARIDIDSPVVGMYADTEWHNGNYLDLVLSGHRPGADIRTADGFTQRVTGNSLTLSARVGRSYALDNGWAIEPQLQLTASQMHWQDVVDAAGRELLIDDDLAGTARAALRVEKAFTTAGGASIKPWLTLGVQNVVGEKENGMYLGTPGSMEAAQAFPNHDLGTSASLDIGVEAALKDRLSFFGVLSISQDVDGSDLEQREANMGLRIRW
ncbi:autotransporter-associated beta strand repeat-containing protein [Pseudoxanthomonas sacheonensis]|uniref:Fibronectin-binding autotransporter adhesin n=1 Tax=Pseudoxanthomonas sacheonensis TaxID=443615 RepID=A0ABU1RTT4_9GAMM|nr:autotransporter-associated beta strand repeat-containing protein [Pseudoxanthomonas sacheonensis]MDR6842178.1 fibronectin-binding autotransporter adhesin [Pseudoxanthomonas sacheonensis]